MRNLIKVLGRFCSHLGQDQHRPQRKWIFDMIVGIYRSHSLMLSEIGRSLNESQDLFYTEKRLSRNLNSRRLNERLLLDRHLERVARRTRKNDGEGVVIAMDYTDIHKSAVRKGQGMQWICECWDGSQGHKNLGYPIIQTEAHFPDGNRCPVLYHVFSYDQPGHMSQPIEIVNTVRKAAKYVGSKAIWAMDRGFDSLPLIEQFDKIGIRWAIRMRLNRPRSLFDEDGNCLTVPKMIKKTPGRYSSSKKFQMGLYRVRGTLRVGSRLVYLSGFDKKHLDDPRTLVVVRGLSKHPVAILASEYLPGKENAIKIADAYIRRWKAEEATRGMKDSRQWGIRLEDFRPRRFQGVRRLILLSMIVYAFVSELREIGEKVTARIRKYSKSFQTKAIDPVYQMVRGFGNFLGSTSIFRIRRCRLVVAIG